MRDITGKVTLGLEEYDRVCRLCAPWEPGTWIRSAVLTAIQQTPVLREGNACLIEGASRTVTFRLSAEEKAQIDAARARYGDTRTRFIRTILLHILASAPTHDPELGALGSSPPSAPSAG